MRGSLSSARPMELFLRQYVVRFREVTVYPGRNRMPKSQLVAQHVPYLRRYARALTGSQASGDSYVVAALETLVKEPTVLGEDLNPRVALFRLFSKIWNSVPVNGVPNLVVNPAPAERHLGHI